MSKRHVDEYFNTIANQYQEMLQALKDMEEECANNLLDPDRLEQMKTLIEPLKENYMRISYIMFLLNRPDKESKLKEYEERNQKLLSKIPKEAKLEAIQEENQKIIDEIHI